MILVVAEAVVVDTGVVCWVFLVCCRRNMNGVVDKDGVEKASVEVSRTAPRGGTKRQAENSKPCHKPLCILIDLTLRAVVLAMDPLHTAVVVAAVVAAVAMFGVSALNAKQEATTTVLSSVAPIALELGRWRFLFRNSMRRYPRALCI